MAGITGSLIASNTNKTQNYLPRNLVHFVLLSLCTVPTLSVSALSLSFLLTPALFLPRSLWEVRLSLPLPVCQVDSTPRGFWDVKEGGGWRVTDSLKGGLYSSSEPGRKGH